MVTRKKIESPVGTRLTVIIFFFFAAFGALLGRLFLLQIIHHTDYLALAAKQHHTEDNAIALRGKIFAQGKDGALVSLAMPNTEKTLIAVPKNMPDKEAVVSFATQEFQLNEKFVREKIAKDNDPYEILLKKVDPIQAAKFEDKLPQGLFFEEAQGRLYPHGSLAAHLVGFISRDDKGFRGRYGLERQYQDILDSHNGFFENISGDAGFWLALGKRIVNPPKNGSDLVLTIDFNIQAKAEEVLAQAKEKWGAVSGNVLVLDPMTGKILADASLPVFDPNQYGKERDLSIFLNPLDEATYEFGSVVKPIVMAAGVEEKLVTSETTYYDSGEVKFGKYTIRNFDLQAYHTQTMAQVLEKSLNTGMVFVSKLLGHEREASYLQKFGFGEKTNIDLPGEVSGNINNLTSSSGRDIDFATAAFGQGIAETPLQLAMAIGAIANGGILKKPYVVERVSDSSGNETVTNPQDVRRVISPDTAEAITKMLIGAVRNGFENRASVKGYFVAGKTGTAQIPKKDSKGYSDKVVHTFVGYAPAFHPRFLVLLQLNDPKGNRFAANTLTGSFHDLAEYILNYYEIPPDEK